MSKVWIVEAGHDYEGHTNMYVASSKEKAEEYIKQTFDGLYFRDPLLKDTYFDFINIVPYELDTGYPLYVPL